VSNRTPQGLAGGPLATDDVTPADRGHPLAASALIMAAGVLVISLADAAGRAGSASAWWEAAYWLGEAVVFAPAVWRVLSGSGPGESEAAGLVIGLAIVTYILKYLYSPSSFGFPDELEHWRTVSDLLSSHHLFGANRLLPISPAYPGLEEAAGAVAAVTGLSVFAAGLAVAGLSHLLLTVALYVVFRQVSGSARIAAAACTIYAMNPHYQVFDAIFGYQTLALAFFGLTLVATLRLAGHSDRPGRAGWWAVAVAFVAATVVTHHVTSYMLAATLTLLAATGAARQLLRHRSGAAVCYPGTTTTAVLAAICVALIGAWIGWVAPITTTYLAPTAGAFLHGLAGVLTAHAASRGATPAGPLLDQLGNYAAAALIMLAVPVGWRHIWRARRHTWAYALGAGAACYYLVALLRVTTPGGAELAGRSMTFLYIPVSYTLAMAMAMTMVMTMGGLGGLGGATRRRRGTIAPARAPAALGAAGAVILLFGGLASGWPPYWERLPGRYVVDGFESGITGEGLAAASWARTTLGPGHRIAADFTNYVLLGSYGQQDVVKDVDQLYCGPGWTASDAALARQHAVRYLLVDLRTSRYTPATEGYFPDQSATCPAPIPAGDLAKFDSVPGFDRIYDSGNIIVYALPGAQDAP
jgi:hypothetical protein